MNEIFAELGGIIVVAAGCAMLVRLFKQPPLLGYILTGIILGPLGVHLVHNTEMIDGMRQIGMALLLFMVGLELDWTKARHQMKAASLTALVQTITSFAVGFGIAVLTGQSYVTGIFVGIALSFSSAVIIVKFLSESRDLNSLHGRITVGLLIIQDLFAIAVLVIAGGLSGDSLLGISNQIILLTVKVAAVLSLVWILSQHILPPLFARIARSSELLFLSSVAWCFLFAITMNYFDFPLETGAFLAGISLAALPYGYDIVSRLRSLRDFFIILFFVSLGVTLQLPTGSYAYLAGWILAFTMLGKPIITLITLASTGFKSRTAFLTSVTQSQLPEFSLIIVSLALSRGFISAEIVSAITFAMVTSIIFSTFLHSGRNKLYQVLRKPLRFFERGHKQHEMLTEEMEERLHDHIVIFGYHRMGYHILKKLHQLNHQVVIVDFNPDIIRKLRAQGIDCVYGDVEDEEIFNAVKIDQASVIVSTIPHLEETTYLIKEVRKRNKDAKLITTSHSIDNALLYYQLGSDYVILPHLLGGEYVAEIISQYQEHRLGHFMKHQAEELKLLKVKNHALYYE